MSVKCAAISLADSGAVVNRVEDPLHRAPPLCVLWVPLSSPFSSWLVAMACLDLCQVGQGSERAPLHPLPD